MNKKEILKGMTIRELQDVIYEKQAEEAMKKYGTKRETEFKMSEIDEIEADGDGNLFLVRVEDGSEGWEAIVEVDRNIDWGGDLEELVEDHIVNFMIEEGYNENGYVENIEVIEMCRYTRPLFKIVGEVDSEDN